MGCNPNAEQSGEIAWAAIRMRGLQLEGEQVERRGAQENHGRRGNELNKNNARHPKSARVSFSILLSSDFVFIIKRYDTHYFDEPDWELDQKEFEWRKRRAERQALELKRLELEKLLGEDKAKKGGSGKKKKKSISLPTTKM